MFMLGRLYIAPYFSAASNRVLLGRFSFYALSSWTNVFEDNSKGTDRGNKKQNKKLKHHNSDLGHSVRANTDINQIYDYEAYEHKLRVPQLKGIFKLSDDGENELETKKMENSYVVAKSAISDPSFQPRISSFKRETMIPNGDVKPLNNRNFNNTSTSKAIDSRAVEQHEVDPKPLFIEYAFNYLIQNPSLAKDWKQFGSQFSEKSFLSTKWPFVLLNYIANKEERVAGLYAIGMSLVGFVRELEDRHAVTCLVASISLCVHQGGESVHGAAFAFYDELRSLTDVLDASSTLLLIRSFSKTSRWRQCLDFLEMAKISTNPTQAYFSPIVKAALVAGEMPLAEKLWGEMYSCGIVPSDDVFECLIELGMVMKLLSILKQFRWIPSENIAFNIQKHFIGHCQTETWNSEVTKVNSKSVCLSCSARVDPLPRISDGDFGRLREAFMAKAVLKSGNVFLNSTPDEVREFHEFLSRHKSGFDIIIDGLNVAHCISQKATTRDRDAVLAQVIRHFSRDGKRVLVLGRKHMEHWKSRKVSNFEPAEQVEWFFASNVSSEDPFMLYAALHSGHDAMVVTNDDLRDHRFLLGPELSDLLKLWQRGHQILFLGIKKQLGKTGPKFQWPDSHDTRVQASANGDVWHIPFDNGDIRRSFQLPNSWICLHRTFK